MLAQRLADRTLELVDVPSVSRDEARLAAHVRDVLGARDAGDHCVVVNPEAPIVLAGHFDTVPPQDNLPGRRDDEAVHGLGAADMKGALAVMVELALAGAPFGFVFFPREELPHSESALTPLLEREPALRDTELAIVMEPTSNALHVACVGNINARIVARGRSGHSARPWTADNAIHRLAAQIAAVAEQPYDELQLDGLTFREAMSVVLVEGGIAQNVVPDRAEAVVNYRYAPGRSPEEAERRLHEVVGEGLEVFSNAPSGAVPSSENAVVAKLRGMGLAWEPKQAWTPVAEFAQAGVDAINFGPGEPRYAHTRDELVRVDALVEAYETLERLCA
jgi:succinyl-diaminopimelate desuccinylase